MYSDDDEFSTINDIPEVAPHTLLTTADGEHESLDIRLFFDVSVLEIFVNERVVISTRVYPESGKCFGLQPFATYREDGGNDKVETKRCIAWELKQSIVHKTRRN